MALEKGADPNRACSSIGKQIDSVLPEFIIFTLRIGLDGLEVGKN